MWQPEEQGLYQIVELLGQSLKANQAVQTEIYQKLQEFHKIPDYNNYLLFIFRHLQSPSEHTLEIRVTAGLLLKNNVEKYYTQLHTIVQSYLKSELLFCLSDQADPVRKTAGGIISTIARTDLENWPGLLEKLTELLTGENQVIVDGTLITLSMICEDCAVLICNELNLGKQTYINALSVLIPTLIKFLSSPIEIFRKSALACLNLFIDFMPELLNNFDLFMSALLVLINDPSTVMRKTICTSFVTLGHVRPAMLVPVFKNIANFALTATVDPDPDLALEACEFWAIVSEKSILKNEITTILSALIPVLLQRMIYSEVEQEQLIEEENAHIPDKMENMAPINYKSRSDEDFDSDSEDDDGKAHDYSDWTIRKCAAQSLDSLSNMYGNLILPVIIPHIIERIASPHWAVLESAILALGAISKGCHDGMKQYLPELVPFLIKRAADASLISEVKNIICWTLSQYSTWIVRNEANKFLAPLLEILVNLMIDKHKSVQYASCSALLYLQESTKVILLNYYQPIISAFAVTLNFYQAKNREVLYDTIGIFAKFSIKSSNNEDAKCALAGSLLPLLVVQHREFQDDDKTLCIISDCISDIIHSVGGKYLEPFAKDIFVRCLRIIDTSLINFSLDSQIGYDTDFVVSSLDLLGALVAGLHDRFGILVESSNLLGILLRCMKEGTRIRQAAFALLGDMCPYCIKQLVDVLKYYFAELLDCMKYSTTNATANACWAFGMVMRYTDSNFIMPYASDILAQLKAILSVDRLSRSLLENAVICLGWLGFRCPGVVAAELDSLFYTWCCALCDLDNDSEKHFAFLGLCSVIEVNTNAIYNLNLLHFCSAISTWDEVDDELFKRFHKILHYFKSLAVDQWPTLMNKLDPVVRAKLARYEI